MSQKKIGGGVALLAGLSAMIVSIYIFMLGTGSNHNLINVILYLCCGAIFFFWGLNLIIPNKHPRQSSTDNKFSNPAN
jgi:hypothetical protein